MIFTNSVKLIWIYKKKLKTVNIQFFFNFMFIDDFNFIAYFIFSIKSIMVGYRIFLIFFIVFY